MGMKQRWTWVMVLPNRCHRGQNYNYTRFRQLLCPDPFCEVCNTTTVDVNQLLCPEVLEGTTPSVSPLASTAPVTESSPSVSPADSAVPPGDLTPASLKGKPKELHVHEQPPYPKTLGSQLKQEGIQLFWGPPSLHSESLSSAAHGLGDYSIVFIFNAILNASAGQESPELPHLIPLSLPEKHPQPQLQVLPLAQPPPVSHGQTQAHLPSQPRIPPFGPLSQMRICGVCFHGPQNDSDSLSSSEIQGLEWNVFQKQQECLWGFPAEVQRSQAKFCPLAPSFPICKASQPHASISILPGAFPLSDEIRKKLEQHLQKRLIKHSWGLPHRVLESLSPMMPPSDSSEISGSKRNHGLSQRNVLNDKSSKNLNVGLSQPGSFQKWASEILQLEKDVGKGQGQSPESG
ncbi:spermatogenesis-associated protein 31D3-like [Manis pentadactyla]|uniref:spermatogenesis-associated protein 31D3-like n=1 Tax=Manis pentadactyla TaxID=143292 RepID=UPI00255CF093|nr:spermatogenesis-associated protein 31D3-like [Manis pentadactyla]